MHPIDLRAAFESAYKAPIPAHAAELVATLAALWERGQAAWPSVLLDPASFARYVAERTPPVSDLSNALGALDAEGLYLACACVQRDPAALALFHAEIAAHLDRPLERMGLSPSQRDDLRSQVEQLLLYGEGEGPPVVASYGGRGTLRGWARSVAIKRALTSQRLDHRHVALDDEIFELPADQTSPDIAYVRDVCLEEFRGALAGALRRLERSQRNLLRQHYLDGMSLEAVARVHRVHRATAARWLAEAREAVLAGTRDELAGALQLTPSEVDSVLSFAQRTSSLGDDLSRVGDWLRARP